ncbi:DNA adenine methyltransferase YhdJ [termite gut metagenome]|uniref:DNA adenine methyltransferase YhdJ n=1 Tax=termite gut metagenome TaxID=433724 RepID=A0A5J4SL72_9ZZZZ
MTVNQLILGDNLEVLKGFASESVDLIYLDPPFFSNRNYEVIWGDTGEVRSFQDRWAGGIDHYIAWLKERVEQMHRILKPTGSIFLHCDWHANAYIRVDILDKIFGKSNFRNEITWQRTDTHNDATKQFPNICDVIFYYAKSDEYTFNVLYTKHNPKTLKEWYQYVELPDGSTRKITKEENEAQVAPTGARRFNLDNTANPTKVWEGGLYEYKGYKPPKNGWRYSLKTMEELDKQGLLVFPKSKDGRIMRKRYLDEQKGRVVGDVWTDISQIRAISEEAIGYPTQKPESLLKRIIECASNEGDIVLDPFVGGGTTVAVADKLNRRWIGIDQSVQAVKVSDLRLKKQQDLYSQPYELRLRKYDYDMLRSQDAFEFESWIIEQFGGTSNIKQRSDLGLDGKMPDNTPIQVKRSDNIGRNVIDNFFAAAQRSDKKLFEKNKTDGKPVGYIIAFSFSRGAIEEVARLKNKENIIIELKKVGDIVPYGKGPKVTLTAEEIEPYKYVLEASAESEEGIEFYSWDFNHNVKEGFKADVILDKEGKQTRKFNPGTRHIAVEAVDKHGLEATDTITINTNS